MVDDGHGYVTRLVFIMAGQSNMSGRAPLPGPSAANGSRIYRWLQDDSGTWVQNPAEPMDIASGEALSVAADTDAAFGPQLAFADRMAALRPSVEIGILSVAKGNTAMKAWQPDWCWRSLYGAMLRRAQLIEAQGHTLAGLCFWQGESDAKTVDDAADWGAGFTAMVRCLRQDLMNFNLPVVFCQLGPNPNDAVKFPGWDEVQKRQNTMRAAYTAMVTTSDLPVQADKLHMTQAGYITAGQRMAVSMDSLLTI